MRALSRFAAAAFIATGCRSAVSEPSAPLGMAVASLSVTSTSFRSNGPIPVDYSRDGAGKSPQLTDREAIDGAMGGQVLAAGTLVGEFSHGVNALQGAILIR